MKKDRIPKILILFALISGLQQPGFSQDLIAEELNRPNNPELGELVSTYREYFKWEEYESALPSWWTLFNDFPESSERLYVDGVTIYRHFIEETPQGQARNARIDTLMLIYDQRMSYFGGEGNILGRKGIDLLRYQRDDSEHVLAAYGMLKKSLDIEGARSRETVMLNYVAAGLLLRDAAIIDKNQVLEDYFLVTGLLDQQEGGSSRWERTRASIDEMIKKDDILSCEGLDLHFGPQFEQNSGHTGLLEKMINSYTFAGCNESALYIAASEKLYEIDPGPESAHQLAMLFIGRNDLEKAAWYLEMAVLGENLSNKTRAEWFYELSIVSQAKGDHCEAINYAREAKAYRNDYGKAYMALGDAFIACRKRLGDDFQQQSAYWAAADMYQVAAEVDPTLAEESGEKLAICAGQYPSAEDIFFQDLEVGKSFRVGGCIQENTTVRSRD
jgi:tetratricopeptide (TPR) repeat protein